MFAYLTYRASKAAVRSSARATVKAGNALGRMADESAQFHADRSKAQAMNQVAAEMNALAAYINTHRDEINADAELNAAVETRTARLYALAESIRAL